ncbi:hypothetical protein JTB14_026418 [Gonioctena quinquepunctata]|nr:hypothetical protein JTB14_026418 [Gonioctena quinquepunctata]
MRKKKKEGLIAKIVHLVHKIIFGVVIVAVLIFILKFFYAALAFGYWVLSLKYFLLKAIKFWIWIKRSKGIEPIIHYEHAEHDHHSPTDIHVEYDHDDYSHGHDDDHHDYGHQSYWGREDYAHKLAYSKQKPEESLTSWLG